MHYLFKRRPHSFILVALFLLPALTVNAFPSGADTPSFNVFIGTADTAEYQKHEGAIESSPETEAFCLNFSPGENPCRGYLYSRHKNNSDRHLKPLIRYFYSASEQSHTFTVKSTFSWSTKADTHYKLASFLDTSANNLSIDRDTGQRGFEVPQKHKPGSLRNKNVSNLTRFKRAELLSLATQLVGMAVLQAVDAWDTGYRPFARAKDNLRRAWTKAPEWDNDPYYYNYIGHPYTGSVTYNLMRSQNASPLVSWLFSCSQSFIWEFTLEAMEQQPSIQDLLITSNVGSLIGEGFHRLTGKLRKNGLSLSEKFLVLLINPGHVMNNGFR